MATVRSLLGIAALTAEDLTQYLDAAQKHVEERSPSTPLAGKTVLNLFLEPSTRTRVSFETAAKRLGAHVINVGASGTSVVKGESLVDTLHTIHAMGPDVIVLRHQCSGAAIYAAGKVSCPIINGGDGRHEHPTQALLDVLTVRQVKGDVEGLKIAIVGDVLHSRVARSAAHAFRKLGATVTFGGPASLVPRTLEALGARVVHSVASAVEGADVVMALRVQKERMSGAFFPNDREYARWFGLNEDVLRGAADDAILMHPGPMNRGVEITGALADSERSVIRRQVANGVAVRMAVLERACA